MSRPTFTYLQTAEGTFILTQDGIIVAVEGVFLNLLTFFTDLRRIIMDEGFNPSMSANKFDTSRGHQSAAHPELPM